MGHEQLAERRECFISFNKADPALEVSPAFPALAGQFSSFNDDMLYALCIGAATQSIVAVVK